MNFHEILASLPEDLASELFAYLHSEEKSAYQSCLATLADQRKMRPIFLQRKPAKERSQWMQKQASRPANDTLAGTILQIWLTGKHSEMLVRFLDAMKIPHDGKGALSEIPKEPEAGVVNSAVETLLGDYPQTLVAVYLQTFEAMDEGNWPTLKALLESDARFKISQ